MNLALIGHNICAKNMSWGIQIHFIDHCTNLFLSFFYSIQNLVTTMNDFDVRMTDSEFISDDDVNSLSDVCMEDCVNLSKEWQEKIKQIGVSLYYVYVALWTLIRLKKK